MKKREEVSFNSVVMLGESDGVVGHSKFLAM